MGRTAIIGAGPAGLAAAYELSKAGEGVDLYEATERVGGLSASIQLWGHTVDLGPHRFFTRDEQVKRLWLDAARGDYIWVWRKTSILYNEKLFRYPFEPLEIPFKLGTGETIRCLISFARERWCPTEQDGSLESWLCKRFGRRLFEIFFKSYNEKLWGLNCRELHADFAAQRIRQFSLSGAIVNAFSGKRCRHRTLIDRFAYPISGSGMVYSRIAKSFEKNGGRVFLKTPVLRVLTDSRKVKGLYLANGIRRDYDTVVSSMPLNELLQSLSEAPAWILECGRQLSFRSTIIVYLRVANPRLWNDNWIYINSSNELTGRITNFRNWSPHLYGDSKDTILGLEYWCEEGDQMWRKANSDLVHLATKEAIAAKLIAGRDLIRNGHVHRVSKSYPIYRKGYRSVIESLRLFLDSVAGLHVIGRYGSFKYNNQDHSIKMGLLAAENILKRDKHDLWSVNSDYDTYQE